MILIFLLIYIIGFFVTNWMVGPTHYINGEGIPNDDAQRGIALLWPITLPIFIASLPVSIVRQVNKFIKPLTPNRNEPMQMHCSNYRHKS